MRIHGAKILLSRLRNLLHEAGRENLASRIDDLISSYRSGLELLEESYIEGGYGEFEYIESQARMCIEVAGKSVEVLGDIERQLA